MVALTNLFESVQQVWQPTRMSLGDVIWITYRTQSAGIQSQSFEAFDETEIAPRSSTVHTSNLFVQDQAPPASPGSSSSLPAVPLTVVFLSSLPLNCLALLLSTSLEGSIIIILVVPGAVSSGVAVDCLSVGWLGPDSY